MMSILNKFNITTMRIFVKLYNLVFLLSIVSCTLTNERKESDTWDAQMGQARQFGGVYEAVNSSILTHSSINIEKIIDTIRHHIFDDSSLFKEDIIAFKCLALVDTGIVELIKSSYPFHAIRAKSSVLYVKNSAKSGVFNGSEISGWTCLDNKRQPIVFRNAYIRLTNGNWVLIEGIMDPHDIFIKKRFKGPDLENFRFFSKLPKEPAKI